VPVQFLAEAIAIPFRLALWILALSAADDDIGFGEANDLVGAPVFDLDDEEAAAPSEDDEVGPATRPGGPNRHLVPRAELGVRQQEVAQRVVEAILAFGRTVIAGLRQTDVVGKHSCH